MYRNPDAIAMRTDQPPSQAAKPLTLLVLIPSLRRGGAERVIITLLRYLSRARFSITLAVIDMRGAVLQQDLPPDIELLDLQGRRVRHALPGIVKLIRSRQPHTVLSTLGHLNLALAMLRPLLPRQTRFVARETSVVSQLLPHYSRPGLWALAYRLFYPRFDRVICQSHDMREDLITRFGLPADKAVHIPNPLDLPRIRQLATLPLPPDCKLAQRLPGTLYLVAAGRMVPQKGFDLLLRALALMPERQTHLTLLGNGPQTEPLQQLARQLGIHDRIEFAGEQENPFAFFARADALVLSSRFEGLPNVVLEALACALPVIATPAPGGVTEILSGIAACKISHRISAEALADTLRDFDPACRPAADSVAPYLPERITPLYEDVLQ